MKAFTKILAGGVGLAALAAAAPAAAQYYPGYPGGGYGGYGGYGQGGPLGQILDSILGGQRYAQNDRFQIDMCVRATEARLNGYGNQYGGYGGYDPRYGGGYGGYGGAYDPRYGGSYDPRYGGQYGYGSQYGYNQGGARVVRITHVERRSNRGLKVYGLADAGMTGRYGNYGYDPRYGGYGGYNSYGGGAEYRFNCKVDYRGRVTDVDLDRNTNYSRRYR